MMRRFGSELKRRRVVRTAALYVVAAWLALQIVEVLAGAGLPPDFMRKLLASLVALFPVVLVIGWFFDVSREGIQKTAPRAPEDEEHRLAFLEYVQLTGIALALSVSVYILITPQPYDETAFIAVLAFQDSGMPDDRDPLGGVLADEVRRMLAIEPAFEVTGPATSRLLGTATEDRFALAEELAIDVLLDGRVNLSDGKIDVEARIVQVSDRQELWSANLTGPFSDVLRIQQEIVDAVMTALAEQLPGDQAPARISVADCTGVYDAYLQARQLISKPLGSEPHGRGADLLEEIVAKNPDCAVAWEALATARVDWTDAGFAKAGAAARRALELNPYLPEAWAVLAEIAEQEARWIDAESYFLRALDADPSDARVNEMYAESLTARGRVSAAKTYALRAYRSDPASRSINFHLTGAAQMSGDYDLAIKHAEIADRLSADALIGGWMILASSYLLKGDDESALEIFSRHADMVPSWTEQCVKARHDLSLRQNLVNDIKATNDAILAGEISGAKRWYQGGLIIRCATRIEAADFLVDLIRIDEDSPTEALWFPFFYPDAGALRQHPGFRKMVVEDGLLDYWREVAWSDYCHPVGDDDFRCD